MSFLTEAGGRQFFPRGYGMAARRVPAGDTPAAEKLTKRLAVNAGLWLGDPDIDAVTRLATPINATHYTRDENFFVAAGAWTSFNSQNTAIAKEALPAYFLSPYVGRYDDIFISYVIKRIADHLGHGVGFGQRWCDRIATSMIYLMTWRWKDSDENNRSFHRRVGKS